MTSSSPRQASLQGLYVILDIGAMRGRLPEEALREAIAGGARLFQYRDKTSSMREAYQQACRLRQIAADAGATFIVNDRCDLALAVEADGVHLGQEDLPLAHARAIMGRQKLIGISTHRPEQVLDATVGGADYIGFGPIFRTSTKPDHEPIVGIEGIHKVRSLTSLPLFAIGGITLDTAGSIVEAGADGVAVISAIWSSEDIARTVELFIRQLSQASPLSPG